MTTAGLAFVYFLILLVCSGLAHSLSEKVVLPFAVAHAGSSTLAVVVLGWVGSLVVWVSLFLAFVLAGFLAVWLGGTFIKTFAVMIGFLFTAAKYFAMGVALVLLGVAAS